VILRVLGPWGVCTVMLLCIIILALPAIQNARESARRQATRNKLRGLGKVLHHDDGTAPTPTGAARLDMEDAAKSEASFPADPFANETDPSAAASPLPPSDVTSSSGQ
jgi:hypothetical protein